jgi:hypothetical protein
MRSDYHPERVLPRMRSTQRCHGRNPMRQFLSRSSIHLALRNNQDCQPTNSFAPTSPPSPRKATATNRPRRRTAIVQAVSHGESYRARPANWRAATAFPSDYCRECDRFSGSMSFPPPFVLRGKIEVGVLRQRLRKAQPPSSAAAVDPHPTLPLSTRGGVRGCSASSYPRLGIWAHSLPIPHSGQCFSARRSDTMSNCE